MHSATFFLSDFSVAHGGRNVYTNGKQYKGGVSAAAASQSVRALFQLHAQLSES